MAKTDAHVRFVILSAARSGTSLLADTLDSHPQIVCHGEIFHPDPEWHIRGDMAGWSKEDKRALSKDRDNLLDRAFTQPGAKAVGFKMWQNQAPDISDRLLADESVRKIIFERRNKLSQFSSTALAVQTGVWNIGLDGNTRPPKVAPLAFDDAAFHEFLSYQNDVFSHYRATARGPVLDMAFQGLLQDGFGGLQTFLGVKVAPLQAQKRRLHGTDILARFRPEDHDRIRAVLDGLGQADWISE
ncbi:sulfotransferase [Nioella nitratireducens]|uniref:sulfotransferase n=1 Tax=Nioella nitratireducens TaxID=1287720 RepID=UPI0008FD1620|nr:sulfotransferase [Nioella nitratireducens]